MQKLPDAVSAPEAISSREEIALQLQNHQIRGRPQQGTHPKLYSQANRTHHTQKELGSNTPPSSQTACHYTPSLTSIISSATPPWASRCTASAASLLGASQRQKTLPVPSSYQYRKYLTSCFPST